MSLKVTRRWADASGVRKLALLIGVIASAWSAESSAQIRFATPSVTQIAGGAPSEYFKSGLSIGDLDHDGIPDVVAPSWLGALALLGRGDGSLSLPITAGGYAPFSSIADFDNDGHADIGGVHGITYGDGTAGNWQLVSFASGYRGGVVAADFDGDGRMDLAAVQVPDTILTFLSRPNRTVHRVVGVTGMPWMQSTMEMRACDLNRDGRPDIALIPEPNDGSSVYTLIGRGDGTFDSHALLTTSPQGLGIADFTGDDILDIAVADRFLISLFRGLGDGTFAPRQIAVFDTLDERDMVAGDVTGDGIPDLVTTDPLRRRLLTRAGVGNGTFGPRIVSDIRLPLLGLELADMNGDGYLDVVSLCEDRVGVAVTLGDGRGRFGAQPKQLATGVDYSTSLAMGDVDGDGRMDVVAVGSDYATSSLKAFLNLGGRNYGGPLATALLDSGNQFPWRVHLVDLDHDSRLDAVIDFQWAIQTALGTGDGRFVPRVSMSFSSPPGDICLADANGDSTPDLIATSAAGLRVWPGTGDGTFAPVVESALPAPPPLQIAPGDLNGDGIVDVGVATANGVTHAIGVGNGTFVSDPIVWQFPFSSYGGVVVGDVTGDGRDDLMGMWATPPPCESVPCGRIASRIQDAQGGLGAWFEAPWPRSWEHQVTDVDGDGVFDIVFATELGFGAALADPGGYFTIEPGYGAADASDLRVGDLDGDGRQDVAMALEGGIAVYYGRDPDSRATAVPPGFPARDARVTRILSASPNPARSQIRVRFLAAGAGPVALRLYDAAGRRIRTLHRGILEPGDAGRETVASADDLRLVPGLYFLHLTSHAGSDTRRVIFIR